MNVMTQAELPFSRISREFVGADHGEDVEVCLIFVDAPPGRGPRLHRHPYAEVFVVQEGEALFRAAEEERTVVGGELVVIPPGTPHGFTATGDTSLRMIAIQPTPSFSTEWLEE